MCSKLETANKFKDKESVAELTALEDAYQALNRFDTDRIKKIGLFDYYGRDLTESELANLVDNDPDLALSLVLAMMQELNDKVLKFSSTIFIEAKIERNEVRARQNRLNVFIGRYNRYLRAN